MIAAQEDNDSSMVENNTIKATFLKAFEFKNNTFFIQKRFNLFFIDPLANPAHEISFYFTGDRRLVTLTLIF